MKIRVIDEAEEFIIINCCDYSYYYEWPPEPPLPEPPSDFDERNE